MDIKDKVIIITGASQGIGLAAAKHLSGLGAKVVLAARSKDTIKKLEKELPGSLAIVTDMKKILDIRNLMKKTVDEYGRIDILINNAGQGMYGELEHMDINDFHKIMDLNVFSVVEAMQEVIPHMRRQGGGMILNVSSQVSRMYIPGMSAYSATKYALNAISLIAREELAKDNIVVSIILPRMTTTNFAQNAIGSRPDWGSSGRPRPEADTAEKVAEYIENIIHSEEPEIRLQA